MNIALGTIMAVIGAYFLASALIAVITHKDIPPYKWLAEKSRLLWKGGTDYFYMVVGTIIMTLGCLYASGVIWSK